jgi:hypothetical protein
MRPKGLNERGASESFASGQAECELREHERMTSNPTLSAIFAEGPTQTL